MERFPIYSIDPISNFPQLSEIPEPPVTLNIRGNLEELNGKKLVAIVGSRKCTSYGKQLCKSLISGLKGQPIVIVSGLALGIDSIAHEAAVEAGLKTISFPGSGLEWKVLYPAQHRNIAEKILQSGGAIISEFANEERANVWTFPKRNRLMAGISDLILVIEAEEQSGTLITARLGTEYNKIVAALPGPVNSPTSYGTNWLIKLGAVPITDSSDILKELGLENEEKVFSNSTILNTDEERVLSVLNERKSRDQIIRELGLEPAMANVVFSTLEIKGMIRESLGMVERIA